MRRWLHIITKQNDKTDESNWSTLADINYSSCWAIHRTNQRDIDSCVQCGGCYSPFHILVLVSLSMDKGKEFWGKENPSKWRAFQVNLANIPFGLDKSNKMAGLVNLMIEYHLTVSVQQDLVHRMNGVWQSCYEKRKWTKTFRRDGTCKFCIFFQLSW